MKGLMQPFPLSTPMMFSRAERLFCDKRLVSMGVDRSGKRGTPTETTYGEWAARTRVLGGVLDLLEVSASGRVGTFAWNSARHLELYFAVPSTGRVLHTLNVRLYRNQITYIINHAEDEVVFVDASLLNQFLPILDDCKTVRNVVVMPDVDGFDLRMASEDPRVVGVDELMAAAEPVDFTIDDENRAAAMCYTSGTTGNPKGVVYSHRSIVLHSMAAMFVDSVGLSEHDVVLPAVPMFHANGWGLPHAAVYAGANLVLPGADLSAPALVELIADMNVTVAAGVPTIWMSALPLLEGRDVSCLNRILCGGSAVPESLSEAYRRAIGIPILQAWGMTETSPLATMARVRSTFAGQSEETLASVRATQGVPVAGVELRIANPDSTGDETWDGEKQGEIEVRGPWVAGAYYKDPTSGDSFTKDGWLRTGDVATVSPHGYVRIVDRTKDLIKSGGEWISSVELENAIMGHPSIVEAAVIAIPNETWQERPLACVVADADATITDDDVIEWLRPLVPKWWLPDEIVFLPELPKTSVGKFSKRDLRSKYSQGPNSGR